MPYVGAMWPLRWSGQSECIDKAFIEKNFQGTLEANLHSIYLKSKNGKPRGVYSVGEIDILSAKINKK
jgi:hypothetical protein